MWVSKHQWERLLERVDKLEFRARRIYASRIVLGKNNEEIDVLEAVEMSPDEAIVALADAVGVKFIRKEISSHYKYEAKKGA